MKEFDATHIKNVVLIGGAKCGKTTLAETRQYEERVIP